jgi:hypothetical protein
MGPPSGALDAGLAATVVALGLLWLGFGLTGLVPTLRNDLVARWALAFPAVVVLVLVAMLIHLATGGALFESPRAVRAGTGLLAAFLLLRWTMRRLRWRELEQGRTRPWRDLGLAVACSLVVGAAWGSPVFRMLPLATDGDIAFHTGWTEQLLHGDSTPTARITGDVPNYYPWLYHALLAFVSDLTPGGHAYTALATLQLLQAAGIAAAFFGIGQMLAGRWAGAATAVLGAAAGGWGFLLVDGLDVVLPRAEGGAETTRYAGDLLFVRSYNVAFLNLAPPYPRDVAVALLVAALFVLARAGRSGSRFELALAGVLLGLVGLTQTDAFAVGVLTALGVAVLAPRGRRLRTGATVLLPAAAIFALWAVPAAVSYVRLGGIVDTTLVPPVELPAWAILGAWGIVTPLAAFGAVRAARSFGDPGVRVVVASLAAGAVAVVASSLVPALLSDGFATIGRAHRYWPLLALPLALLAGLGAHALGARAREWGRPAAWAVAVCVLALALPSPVIASLALPTELTTWPRLEQALEGDREQLLSVLARYGDGVCAAAVPAPGPVFPYTGYRVLLYGHPEGRENAARIRWADIYDHIVPEDQRVRDQELLMSGTATPEQFREIVARYGLDLVVVPERVASTTGFQGLSGRLIRSGSNRYVLYGLSSC